MRWFSSKKRHAVLIDKSIAEAVDYSLDFIARNFGPDKNAYEIQLPSHEYYCDRESVSRDELILLTEKISCQLRLNVRIEVQFLCPTANKEPNLICNHQFSAEQVYTITVPEDLTAHPIHLTTCIVQQLCEKKAAKKIAHNRPYVEYIATLLSFCYGFGLFRILSAAAPVLSANLHLGPLKYDALLYCAASLHDLEFLSIDKFQFYLSSDAWIRLNDLARAIPDNRGRMKFREEWNRNLRQLADFRTLYSKPLHEENTLLALERLATERPADINATFYLAYARMLRGQFEPAIKGFDFAISAHPSLAAAFNCRGLCLLFTGRKKAALEDLKASARLQPGNSYNIRNFGIYWLMQNKPEVALKEFLKAQETDAETEHIHYWLGRAYLDLNRSDDALKEFEVSRQIPELPAPVYPLTT
jgi:tetratricopeptide (TPR) repeat protein